MQKSNSNKKENHREEDIIENYIVSDENFIYPEIDFSTPFFIGGMIFIIIKKGKAKVKINLREWNIEENTLMTIYPGSVIEPIYKSEDIDMEFLFFSVDFIPNWSIFPDLDILSMIEREPCIVVDKKELDNLLDFHSFILKHYKRPNLLYRDVLIKSLLHSMIIELMSIYQNHRKKSRMIIENISRKEFLFSQFIQLASQYHTKERQVAFYADKMCLTSKYLGQVIKEISGKLASEWISFMTVLSIKSSLRYTQKTILQISEDFNFPNPSFFNQFFKKQTGMTPRAYRIGRISSNKI